ncbi:MAG TPA: thioredoxin [Deltaproteobacteria bacterium]|nr:thioredoxin [Deltaproteobacteria bacterium]
MSAGVVVLVCVLAALGVVLGLQAWARSRIAAQRGQHVPALPGPLGEAMRGDVLLFFHSPSCGPCRGMHAHLQPLAASDPRVQIVDVTRDTEAARAFKIMATPTVITVRGGLIEDTRIGAMPPGALDALLATLSPR